MVKISEFCKIHEDKQQCRHLEADDLLAPPALARSFLYLKQSPTHSTYLCVTFSQFGQCVKLREETTTTTSTTAVTATPDPTRVYFPSTD